MTHLAEVIAAHPEWSSFSDAEIESALKLENIPILRETWFTDRTMFAIFTYARATSILDAIEVLGQTNKTVGRIYQMISDRSANGIDIGTDKAHNMIDSLVGVVASLTQDEADAIKATSIYNASIAQIEGLTRVDHLTIADARKELV